MTTLLPSPPHQSASPPLHAGETGATAPSAAATVLCLMLFSALVSLWGLSSGPPLSDHEAIIAQGARQMREGGDWLIPRVGHEEFVRKPPLAFWLAAVASLVTEPPAAEPPVSPASARLPAALAAIVTTALVYVAGRCMFGHRSGAVGGAVWASCVGALFFSHNAQVEMVLTCLMTAAVVSFWMATQRGGISTGWLLLSYAAFALAMLAKAPLPLALVGLPLAVWWLGVEPLLDFLAGRAGLAELRAPSPGAPDQSPTAAAGGQGTVLTEFPPATLRSAVLERFRGLRRLRPLLGVGIVLLIFLPWPVYVYLKVHNVVDLWEIEFLDRYTGDLSGKDRPFWYYVPLAFGMVFPFTLSLPEALASGFLSGYRAQRRALLFVLTVVVVQTGFLSTSAFKRPHYLIGTVPMLALLLGPTLERLFFAARLPSRRRRGAAMAAIVAVVLTGLYFGHRHVVREYPTAVWSFDVGAGILLAGVLVAGAAFFRGARDASFVGVVAMSALCFAWTWDTVGLGGAMDSRAFEMMKEVKHRALGPEDRFTWVIGRPDSRLMYYMGLNIDQLFSALELADRREGRQSVPPELEAEAMARLRTRLQSDRKEYFIIKGRYWDRLKDGLGVPVQMVFRVAGEFGDPKDDWVVITNGWNTQPGTAPPRDAEGAAPP
ncbi:MAG: glycosyltransferase family 39 protein [Planctomycetes bacterium]|nr:glycosyltransferase family 39 protein [Planctomycetota bacterium]